MRALRVASASLLLLLLLLRASLATPADARRVGRFETSASDGCPRLADLSAISGPVVLSHDAGAVDVDVELLPASGSPFPAFTISCRGKLRVRRGPLDRGQEAPSIHPRLTVASSEDVSWGIYLTENDSAGLCDAPKDRREPTPPGDECPKRKEDGRRECGSEEEACSWWVFRTGHIPLLLVLLAMLAALALILAVSCFVCFQEIGRLREGLALKASCNVDARRNAQRNDSPTSHYLNVY